MAPIDWSAMFVPGLGLAEKVLRPVLVYLFLVGALRLAGKRELAQLNAFDLVVLMMLSNTVQNAIIGNDNSVSGGLAGAAALLAVNWLVVRFLYRHRKLDRLVEGRATALIVKGRPSERALRGELITLAELRAAARRQGFATLDEVETAILEPGGAISFIGRVPRPDESRHRELLARLDALDARIDGLAAR